MSFESFDYSADDILSYELLDDENLSVSSPFSPLKNMNTILLKVASHCNLDCKYCYWFRDQSVYKLPNTISLDNETLFVNRLERHIVNNSIEHFNLLFHGGEPLLFPIKRFYDLCDKVVTLCRRNDCTISFSLTTNGVLLNEKWIGFFNKYNIIPAISLDGPKEINDSNRVDLNGSGSFDRVMKKIHLLKKHDTEYHILSVINIDSDPQTQMSFFFSLGIKKLDFLLPDHTHDDEYPLIGDYLIELFNIWYHKYSDKGLEIRFFMEIIRSMLARTVKSEVLGGTFLLSCIYPDGSIRPHDVLGIIPTTGGKKYLHLKENDFVDMEKDKLWNNAFKASKTAPETCTGCRFKDVCEGGYIPHRWSVEKEFDNKTIYCKDLYKLFEHIRNTISQDIKIN